MDGRFEYETGDQINITVPGPPIPKGRPRAAVIAGQPRLYTPKKTQDYERTIGQWARRAMGNRPPMSGPVIVAVVSLFPIPASRPKYEKRAIRNGLAWCCNQSDVDNLAKSALDGINGIVFEDDRQVIELISRKDYANEGRLLIRVEQVVGDYA